MDRNKYLSPHSLAGLKRLLVEQESAGSNPAEGVSKLFAGATREQLVAVGRKHGKHVLIGQLIEALCQQEKTKKRRQRS